MRTYQVNILNPKAVKLLEDLADLDLISITLNKEDSFFDVLNNFRANAADNPPSLEDITSEVESVRAERYARKKG